MSALFAILSKEHINHDVLLTLASESLSRGKNSSALLVSTDYGSFDVYKSRLAVTGLSKKVRDVGKMCVGYAGLNVSHHSEVAPTIKNDFFLFHDGIVNDVPQDFETYRETTPTNSEHILETLLGFYKADGDIVAAVQHVVDHLSGTINCILVAPKLGKLILFSNHGSLYFSENNGDLFVASERYTLRNVGGTAQQVKGVVAFDMPAQTGTIEVTENHLFDSAPALTPLSSDVNLLQYKAHSLQRCTRCILPETMPYIRFDAKGVCNYCHSYKPRNQPKDKQRLHELVEPYRRASGYDCIVPFSGGRDSCAVLHLVVNELKLKPITYTYDWGMVTDVGRRNIALMCGALGVENIVVADDIEKKRRNIAMNFAAWLKRPHLGMLNILTAGDKHFFRYVNKVKEDTGVSLNLWGVNPLEVTHFKTGFLGIEPDFERQRVYASGKMGQLRYQGKRLRQMLKSPGYFNTSLWDTWSGEYYRSAAKKTDYFHVFDYWQWSEAEINALMADYGWELASDTPTTWRIGDGTAGIYNYIYYTLAGFTEHDTFRSNQIREGEFTREEALRLVERENAPCHDNLRWYLASIGFDFVDTIKRINAIPRLHEKLY